jgi:putative Holliday junction resolvase
MLYKDFKDFTANIPPTGQLLGIDWGSKRMGFAVSDNRREFAFPRANFKNEDAINEIIEIIALEKIVGIVVGLPLREDGSGSKTVRAIKGFSKRVAKVVPLPIGYMNERYSSWEANERNPSAKLLDKHAAAIILQDALAMIKRIKTGQV